MSVDAAGISDSAAVAAALLVAREALPLGEVPIGAVVFGPAGAVLSNSYNERMTNSDPTGHAEVLALRRAGAAYG